LIYNINTNIKQPTIIFTSKEYWYPNGYFININPNSIVNYIVNGNYIEIYNTNNNKNNGQTVTVNIIAKN